MGIELPTPGGEHAAPIVRTGESAGYVSSPESNLPSQSVENGTTERPALQEAKMYGQGGNGQMTTTQTDDSTTTDLSPAATTPSLDDVPVVAADEDLIEKQWVDSVKRIVHDNRNDPFKQSEAISRLQADYLQKRYGKTVGQAGNA